ncbi:MAG: peptide ABC transporter substrate-binding protein, partial [Planctomycetales bacterium]|nr:peptide ABC transporter substrate-binding protein [Planctomycetales bacterium]
PVPDLAESWEVSPDGLRYTFHLRPSQWTDGRPLTAEDFAWSWKRVLRPETASKYASMMYVLKNGEAVNRRALLIEGLPKHVDVEALRTFVTECLRQRSADSDIAARIDQIRPSDDPPGAFLFLSADEASGNADIQQVRQTIVESVAGRSYSVDLLTPLSVRIADDSLVRVAAEDDQTLTVHLENPIPYFLHVLSYYTFMPVPRHVLERLQQQGKNPDLWTRPEHIVSNGAYQLKEWKFRQYGIFERNDRYWLAPQIRLKRVKLMMIENYNTCLNMYKTGEIDWLGRNTPPPSEFLDHLAKYKDFHNEPNLSSYFYWVNTKRPPLDNVHLRRALSLAIDRESLVKYVARGGQLPTADLVPDGIIGYESLRRPLFDPDEAKRQLAAAGYPNGQGLPAISLIYNTTDAHKQIAVAIQQMWKKHLGIEIQIENLEWNVYLKRLADTDFQIARLGWNADYADPFTFLELFSAHSGNNHSNWANAEYDQLLRDANASRDATVRMATLRAAEQLMLDAQPVIPLYVYTRPTMVKPYLHGYYRSPMDRHPWKWMWIETGDVDMTRE